MASADDNVALTSIGGWLFFVGIFLFASGVCTYIAGWLAAGAEGLSGVFYGLLSIPFKLLSLPALLFQGIVALVVGGSLPEVGMFGAYTEFGESVKYLWTLPILGSLTFLAGKRSWHDAYLTPLVAILFPNSLAGRTRQTKKESDMFAEEASRSEKAAELDDLHAEIERTKHKLRRAKESRD